jgi:chromosome partitioning protein
MRIIAMINQKGGVGKTTSVVNIGAGLAGMKRKVLLVDMDPQAHLTYSLGIKADELEITVYELLKGESTLEQTVIETAKLKLIPASIDLAAAEIEFSTEIGREALLKNVLEKVSGFDFILLDCPPNLGLLTLNALTAVKEAFVPLQAEYLSTKGLNKLMSMIEKVESRVNPALEINGIIATLYDKRLRLHREVFQNLSEFFGDKLFKTFIRRNVALAEASSFGQSIYEYAPTSHGAEDYRSLCKEILKRGKQHG